MVFGVLNECSCLGTEIRNRCGNLQWMHHGHKSHLIKIACTRFVYRAFSFSRWIDSNARPSLMFKQNKKSQIDNLKLIQIKANRIASPFAARNGHNFVDCVTFGPIAYHNFVVRSFRTRNHNFLLLSFSHELYTAQIINCTRVRDEHRTEQWRAAETRFYAFYLLCARTLVWFIILAITNFTVIKDGNGQHNVHTQMK